MINSQFFLLQKNKFLPALVLFILAFVSNEVQAKNSFSFEEADKIYGQIKTSTNLLSYLQRASVEDRKDYRYLIFTIKGLYARNKISEGDDLIERAITAAKKSGVSKNGQLYLRNKCKVGRNFWIIHYSRDFPIISRHPVYSGGTSGNFQSFSLRSSNFDSGGADSSSNGLAKK